MTRDPSLSRISRLPSSLRHSLPKVNSNRLPTEAVPRVADAADGADAAAGEGVVW